jgi:hypothetical protein
MEALLPALKHALKQIKGDKREKHPRHTPHAAAAPVDQWERSFRAASAGSGGGCSCDPWTLMDTCIHVHVDPWTELGNQESTPERKRVLHTSYQHPCRCWSFGFVDCNVYHVRNAELLSDISPSLFHELYCDPNKVQVQFLKSSTRFFEGDSLFRLHTCYAILVPSTLFLKETPWFMMNSDNIPNWNAHILIRHVNTVHIYKKMDSPVLLFSTSRTTVECMPRLSSQNYEKRFSQKVQLNTNLCWAVHGLNPITWQSQLRGTTFYRSYYQLPTCYIAHLTNTIQQNVHLINIKLLHPFLAFSKRCTRQLSGKGGEKSTR